MTLAALAARLVSPAGEGLFLCRLPFGPHFPPLLLPSAIHYDDGYQRLKRRRDGERTRLQQKPGLGRTLDGRVHLSLYPCSPPHSPCGESELLLRTEAEVGRGSLGHALGFVYI